MTKLLTAASVAVVSLILLALLYYFATSISDHRVATEIGLPVIAIAAIVSLLVALALVSMSFSVFELGDRAQALALPEGSVRAVIALILLVLFGITSIYLYDTMSATTIAEVPGFTAEEAARFEKEASKEVIAKRETPDGKVTVIYRNSRDPESDDFAKQLLVMFGTLVTSISAFYFGTKATSAQGGETEPAAPIIRNVTRKQRDTTAVSDLEIAGEHLEAVKDVKLVSGANQIVASDIMKSANLVKCAIKTDTTAPPKSAWDLIVTDGAGQTAKLANAVTLP